MTEEEILKLERTYSESKIQHICVCWFNQTFPKLQGLLFSANNGGMRSPKAAAMMKYEGAVSGVSDLILLCPSGGKASLCIEMKKPKKQGRSAGVQSANQKSWQALVSRYGSIYVVCHGLIEFIIAVCSYFKISPQSYIDNAVENYAIFR